MTADDSGPTAVLVAGDTHGDLGWIKVLVREAAAQDCSLILQVGDFGYWEHAGRGRDFLDRAEALLEKAGIDLWWIDGNHENHTLLRAMYQPRDDGLCEVRPHILYVPRGHRWTWQGVTFLGLGGAFSVDKRWRIEGESWWPEETITEGDVHRATEGGAVDVVVSHDCPWGIDCMGSETVGDKDAWPESEANRRRLLAVVNEVKPRLLFHGHYHHRHTATLTGRDFATRIEGLGRDGDPASFVVLNLLPTLALSS